MILLKYEDIKCYFQARVNNDPQSCNSLSDLIPLINGTQHVCLRAGGGAQWWGDSD